MQFFTASKEEILNLTLSEIESKHCVRVLRKKNGDTIHLTDGKGNLHECLILDAHPKYCKFSITKTIQQNKISPPLHIVIAPTKNIDRFEFFLEKATEIGIQEITPLLSFHSERKNIKLERLEKIVVSACKQSKNFHFPTLNTLTPFKEVLKNGDVVLIPYIKYLAFIAIIIIGITTFLKDEYVSVVLAAALPILIWGLVMYIKGHKR